MYAAVSIENHVEITNYSEQRKTPGFLNSETFKDREYPLQHTNFRILALGDSFTEGQELRHDGTWPKLTEQELHRLGWEDVEILNGGRLDTDTKEQLEILRTRGLKYNPDLVIVAFLLNDCSEICATCGIRDLMQKHSQLRSKKKPHSSALLSFLQQTFLRNHITRETIEEYKIPYSTENPLYQECTKAFEDMKQLADERGFPLVVVLYPILYKLDDYPFSEIHKHMLSFFESIHVPAYDLLPYLAGHRDTDLWLQQYDSHPNRTANQLVSKGIAQILLPYRTQQK